MKKNRCAQTFDSKIMLKKVKIYLKRRKVRNQKMNKKAKLSMGKIVERFSYGCGDFGCNIIYTAMSAFLVFYYTDYAGVNALAVGTIMMVSRIFDGISDIIMGVIVDRTKSRFGKARSWILRMCIPFAISRCV